MLYILYGIVGLLYYFATCCLLLCLQCIALVYCNSILHYFILSLSLSLYIYIYILLFIDTYWLYVALYCIMQWYNVFRAIQYFLYAVLCPRQHNTVSHGNVSYHSRYDRCYTIFGCVPL